MHTNMLLPSRIRLHTHAHMHLRAHSRTHTCTHMRMHTCLPMIILTRAYALMRMRMDMHVHADAYTQCIQVTMYMCARAYVDGCRLRELHCSCWGPDGVGRSLTRADSFLR